VSLPGDDNQFAMMGVNPPTAYLLLTDIVKLPPESWLIQNGANSGVGMAAIAIAKSLGLRTSMSCVVTRSLMKRRHSTAMLYW
jgi:NADPH:quinone reductase-like Zn-dependent oxidoreductase